MNHFQRVTFGLKVSTRVLATIALIASGLASTLQPAHADWRSLSGGFLPAFAGVLNFKISPDSRWVAFTVDKDTDDVTELYAVSITGTTPIRLNPILVNGGDVGASRFAFTPDSKYVIYIADQEVDNRAELYRVPVSGGDSVKLNTPLVSGGNVTDFKIDPDNARVVYLADQQTNEIFELWSITITGGGLFKLNGAFVSGGDIGLFDIDRISDRVVYSADQEVDGKFELYSTPIAGGAFVKLNPPITLQGGGDGGIYSEWAINPVNQVVVFVAREATAPGGRVYMVPTAGGTLTQLNFNLLSTQRVLNFRISPAGDRVVFNVGTRNGATNAFKGDLYSALIGGGGAEDLTEPADPTFGVDLSGFQFTPDGKYVVYGYQKNAASKPRLESSGVSSGVRAPLYAPSASDPQFGFARISPNSQWVMYQDLAGGSPDRMYTVPPTGGGPTSFGRAQFKFITPDSNRIGYTRMISDAINSTELFSAQIFGGDERNLSGMGGMGYVNDVSVSGDGKWIVYIAQMNGRYDLRVSDGNVAQPPIVTYYANLPVAARQP